MLVILILYLPWIFVHGSAYETDGTKCIVTMNGTTLEKSVGEIWSSTEDLCIKYTCGLGSNGIATESMFREYCYHNCYADYELVPKKGQCCGECIRTSCTFENHTYSIGDVWQSKDKCQFYECASNSLDEDTVEAKVLSYQKACTKLENCELNQIVYKDCCPYCQMDLPRNENDISKNDFVHPTNEHDMIMSRETYLNHPCTRECVENSLPKVCYYKFVVEWYETLSKACFDCPLNGTDCNRPHCIHADGFRRSVLIINRMMPGPMINVCKGDTLMIDVVNNLMGESTSIHWHGLNQEETPFFDGVPQVTQCPIAPHTTFRYKIKATKAETHWWHSHIGMQRADGALGALIIREPSNNLHKLIRNTYEHDLIDHVMIIQDWDHKIGVSNFNSFHHSIGNNKPRNILINGKGRYDEKNDHNHLERNDNEAPTQNESVHAPYEVFNVNERSKYRFRLINSGFLNCPMEISVDNHTLLIIASDGHYFEPISVESLVSYAGERFDFVINTNQPIGNYWMRVKGLMDCDERFLKVHQGAIIRYDGAENQIPNNSLKYGYSRDGFQLNSLNRGSGYIDSATMAEVTSLEPDAPELLSNDVDYKFYVYYDFYEKNFPQFNNPSLYSLDSVSNNQDKFFGPQLNHISMKMPHAPLLVARDQNNEEKFCNASSLNQRNINCRKDFCECTHVLQVRLNSTVEVILVDEGYKYDANHPFHLHGHDFRIVAMERIQSSGVTVEQIKMLDETNKIKRRLSGAPVKDTVTVPDGGYTIIRFIANNPGFWIFHCHIEFHIEVGMALVFKVGDYDEMKPIPKHFPTCHSFMPNSDEPGELNFASNAAQPRPILIAMITCIVSIKFL